MARTFSQMLELGTRAPDFRLPDTTGRMVALADHEGARAFLVIFMCNHCPAVKHVRGVLADLGRELPARGVAMFGINANDTERYPDDDLPHMASEAATHGYLFPYLFDADQSVAMAYRAACTPDIYLFDADRRLAYRGQLDASRPSNAIPPTGADLRAAIDAVLAGRPVPTDQRPSIGCNIKWKPGNEPTWSG